MTSKIKTYLPALLCFSFIVWMIIQADLDQQNILMDIADSIPFGDKIGHFVIFGTFALLLNMAFNFRRVSIRSRKFHLGSVLVCAFAVCEEFTQLAFSSRTFDLFDMLFDLLGIGLLSSVMFRRYLINQLRLFVEHLSNKMLVDVE